MTIEDNDDQPASPGRQRKIIHIDMDAFYASVEQRDKPQLLIAKRQAELKDMSGW
ncbi:hypothetical protein ABIA99_006010 [Bradyrhizobium sp. LB12.1]